MRKRTLITSAIVSVALCACGAPATLGSKGNAPLSAEQIAAVRGATGSTGASAAAGATQSAKSHTSTATASASGSSAATHRGAAGSGATDAQVAHRQATKAAAQAASSAAKTTAKRAAAAKAAAGTTAGSAATSAVTAAARAAATAAATVGAPAPSVPAKPPIAQPAAAVASTNWKTVFTDNFNGTSLSSSWWNYNGLSSASGSYFRPQNIKVSGGSLVLTSTKVNGAWAGAGVGQKTNLKYGRWLIRGKIDRGHGVTFVGLLWPLVGWPPEIDFAEDNAGDRNMMLGTVHYVGGSETSKTLSSIDSTQWHTYGVEWTPGKVVFTVDGRVWATTAAGNTPSQTMRLGLQTEPWTRGTNFFHAIDSSTPSAVHMYIDSVTIQSYGG